MHCSFVVGTVVVVTSWRIVFSLFVISCESWTVKLVHNKPWYSIV